MSKKTEKQLTANSKITLAALEAGRLEANKDGGINLENVLAVVTTVMRAIDKLKASGNQKKSEAVNIVTLIIKEMAGCEAIKSLTRRDVERHIDNLYAAGVVSRKRCCCL